MAEETKNDIQPVVTGEASKRKKSEIQKAADSFIVEDAKTVGAALLADIIVPTIKKTISELIKNGVDMFLYGKVEKTSSTTVRRESNPSYKRYYDRVETIDIPKRASRSSIEYEELVYNTFDDAEEVRISMLDSVKKRGVVTIADMYKFSKIETDNYMYNSWGWGSITGSAVKAIIENGERKYIIKLPKPIPIEWID